MIRGLYWPFKGDLPTIRGLKMLVREASFQNKPCFSQYTDRKHRCREAPFFKSNQRGRGKDLQWKTHTVWPVRIQSENISVVNMQWLSPNACRVPGMDADVQNKLPGSGSQSLHSFTTLRVSPSNTPRLEVADLVHEKVAHFTQGINPGQVLENKVWKVGREEKLQRKKYPGDFFFICIKEIFGIRHERENF